MKLLLLVMIRITLKSRFVIPAYDAYMNVGGRAPTVGTLGDAGAVIEEQLPSRNLPKMKPLIAIMSAFTKDSG